jgi:hypothetical protein
MRAALLLALLAALPPGAAAAGEPEDLDRSASYVAEGAGSLLPVAGLPAWGGDAAPPAAQALTGEAPASEAQGRTLRPAGVADLRWLARAARQADTVQGAVEQDGQFFAETWGSFVFGEAGVVWPGPGIYGVPRPGRDAARWLEGPRIAILAPDPYGTTNRDASLRVLADIASPGGVGGAWAMLHRGSQIERAPMAREGDLWTARFQGPLDAAAEHAVVVEAWDAAAGAPGLGPGFAGAVWPAGYGASDPLPFQVRDAVAPLVRLAVAQAFTRADTAEVRVLAEDDVGIAAMRVDQGRGFGAWGEPRETVRVPMQDDGAYPVGVEVRDAAGNRAIGRARVVRDTHGPEAFLQAVPDAWHAIPVRLAAGPGPSLAPATLRLTLDGSDPRQAAPLEGDAVTVRGPGEVRVRAIASDAAGNLGPEVARIVRIDIDAPLLRLETDLPLDGWLRSQPHLAVRATDPTSGVRSLRVTLLGTTGEQRVQSPAAFTAPEGAHRVLAVADDHAGHATSLEQLVRVDATPPLTRLAAEGEGASRVLRWTALDAGSGVERVRVEARAPEGVWEELASTTGDGTVRLTLVSGEAREFRALAVDLAGNAERKDEPDLQLLIPVAGELVAHPTTNPPAASDAEAAPAPEPAIPRAPRLGQETLAGGAVRVRLLDAREGTLRDAGPARLVPWSSSRELVLDAPGEHRVEAIADGALLTLTVIIPEPPASASPSRPAPQDPAPAHAAEAEAPSPAAKPPASPPADAPRAVPGLPLPAVLMAAALAMCASRAARRKP